MSEGSQQSELQRTLCVIVAEDDAVTRYALSRAVRRQGHTCLEAEDGSQAWDLYGTGGADVIISDWHMPGLDGAELCRRIRGDLNTSYTYFTMLTADDDKSRLVEAMRAGVDDYLPKPFLPEDLEALFIVATRITELHRSLAERARLEGVLLAVRTLEHEINNQLALTMGYAELLERDARLPGPLRRLAQETRGGARQAADLVQRLGKLTEIRERTWGPDEPTTINLSPQP